MWKRAKQGGGEGLWFFSVRHGHRSGIPYIIPNALSMYLSFNLIFMLLMQPYIWMNYFAYKTPTLNVTSRMYFFYGFVHIWDATGMWTSAFGTLYTTLLPKLLSRTDTSSKRVGFFSHPVTLNTLCFGLPVVLIATQVITSVYSSRAWSTMIYTWFDLMAKLKTLSSQWNASSAHAVDATLMSQTVTVGDIFIEQIDKSVKAFQRNAWTTGVWYLVCLLLFTPTAVWLLLVIRRAIGRQSHSSHGKADAGVWAGSKRGETEDAKSRFRKNPESQSLKPLQRAMYTAGLQFLATFACLSVASGSWLWIAADAPRLIVSPALHAIAILLTIWIYVIVGCLCNLFILARARRIDKTSTPSSVSNPSQDLRMSNMRNAKNRSHNRSISGGGRLNQKPTDSPIFIIAHTTTHIVVDKESGSVEGGQELGEDEEKKDVGSFSALNYSSSSVVYLPQGHRHDDRGRDHNQD